MSKIIWKDIDSSTIKGLLICELPPITKPKMRVQETEVDGVDGSIIEELGYETYDKPIRIGLTRDFDIDEVIKYFTGEGNVVFSNEPNKYYKAKIIEQIDYTRLLRFKEAEVKFRVQPFKYEYQEEEQIAETGSIEGTEVKVTDAKLTQMQIDGRSTQETRSGKNLVDVLGNKPAGTTSTINGVTFTVLEDGRIKVNGTATAKAVFYIAENENIAITDGVKTISGGSTNVAFQLSINRDGTYVYPTVRDTTSYSTYTNSFIKNFCLVVSEGQIVNNEIVYLQFEDGSVATEYEPYGVSPSPDYPSEIESVGYENLLDVKDGDYTGFGNVKINVSNGVVTINGNSTSTGTIYINPNFNLVLDGTYALSINKDGGSISGSNMAVCLVKDDDIVFSRNQTENVTVQIFNEQNCNKIGLYINSGTTFNNFVIKPMLLKGTQQHSYIPYGKSGVEVKTTGKNLFNKENASVGYYINYNTGSISKAEDGFTASDFIEVKPNAQYYCNFVAFASSNFGMAFYDENKKFISGSRLYNSITTPDNAKYFRFCVRNEEYSSGTSITDINTVQLEEGSVATEYQPYQERITVMQLNAPLRSLPNGVKDIAYIRNNKLYVDRYIGSVVLNGSESSWAENSITKGLFQVALENVTTDITKINVMSNYFKGSSGTDIVNSWYTNNSVSTYTSNRLFFRSDDYANNLDEFKTLLSTNNVQVDYELATPVTEEYGDLTILQLVDGENNISNSEDANMVIDYIETLTINNLGNYISKPTFEIEGAGQIKFILNGYSVFTYNFDEDGRVVIDSEKEDAYLGSVLKNRNMNGEFPKLEIGENKITWDGLVKNIKVVKKSRWL